MLSDAQIERFSRHILLREVGGTGQERLLATAVRIPRLDAEGRACALWLARAGIGALQLPVTETPVPAVDPAGLLLASDAGRPLAEAVRERLRVHQPELRFVDHAEIEADPRGGPEAALEVVRALLR